MPTLRPASDPIEDYRQDINELSYLHEDLAKKCTAIMPERAVSQLSSTSRSLILENLTRIKNHAQKRAKKLFRLEHLLKSGNLKTTGFSQSRKELKQQIRFDYGLLASAASGVNWQAPTFASSQEGQAGLFTGKIEASVSDYTRDNNRYVMDYEIAFRNEYSGPFRSLPTVCYAVNSGMAAFATVLSFLLLENRLNGTVVIGASTYHESKEQLRKLTGVKVIEVDETRTADLVNIIYQTRPSALFLDTIGNTPKMLIPDFPEISKAVRKFIPKGNIIIDNTSTGPAFDPVALFPPFLSRQTVIVYESLNKLHQFGLDRTMGGIIRAWGKDVVKIFDYREHLGTIIGDTQVLEIPTPSRPVLTQRFQKIRRNAQYLSDKLGLILKNKTTTTGVVYPSAYGISAPFLMLNIPDQSRTRKYMLQLTNRIINKARKAGISIHAGTSFGFDTTRIYPTALRSPVTKPFFRIAPGTETITEIDRIAAVIAAAIN